MVLLDQTSSELNDLFKSTMERDLNTLGLPDYFGRWLFAERLKARGVRGEMGFEAFEGKEHIKKFFNWLRSTQLMDTLPSNAITDFVEKSVLLDRKVDKYFGLGIPEDAIVNMAHYNAQDYYYQRAYHMPQRCAIRTILDFGAGHGRMAALAKLPPDNHDAVDTYIAVEGIPSTYFTQHFYWKALGLKVWDYFEHLDEVVTPETIVDAMKSHDVIHIPTWRLPLVPDHTADLVTCVQVLKELPGELVAHVIPEFSRISAKCGALYIRDHIQFHNPNHMPIDFLIQTNGFCLEFAPQLKDKKELHGIPRIWRKVDASLFV